MPPKAIINYSIYQKKQKMAQHISESALKVVEESKCINESSQIEIDPNLSLDKQQFPLQTSNKVEYEDDQLMLLSSLKVVVEPYKAVQLTRTISHKAELSNLSDSYSLTSIKINQHPLSSIPSCGNSDLLEQPSYQGDESPSFEAKNRSYFDRAALLLGGQNITNSSWLQAWRPLVRPVYYHETQLSQSTLIDLSSFRTGQQPKQYHSKRKVSDNLLSSHTIDKADASEIEDYSLLSTKSIPISPIHSNQRNDSYNFTQQYVKSHLNHNSNTFIQSSKYLIEEIQKQQKAYHINSARNTITKELSIFISQLKCFSTQFNCRRVLVEELLGYQGTKSDSGFNLIDGWQWYASHSSLYEQSVQFCGFSNGTSSSNQQEIYYEPILAPFPILPLINPTICLFLNVFKMESVSALYEESLFGRPCHPDPNYFWDYQLQVKFDQVWKGLIEVDRAIRSTVIAITKQYPNSQLISHLSSIVGLMEVLPYGIIDVLGEQAVTLKHQLPNNKIDPTEVLRLLNRWL